MKKMLLFALLLTPFLLSAQEAAIPAPLPAPVTEDTNWAGDQTLYVGLSMKMMGMNVNKFGSGETLGSMMSNLEPHPMVGYNTKTYFFNDSNWGWFFTSNAGYFRIDTQDVGGGSEGSKIRDVGTEIKGMYSYFSPVFFYHWGDKTVRTTKEQSIKYGFGIGAAYFSVKGDVLLTKQMVPELFEVDTSGVTFSMALLVEYRIGPWMLRAAGGGPGLVDNGKALLFADMSIDAGYAFTF